MNDASRQPDDDRCACGLSIDVVDLDHYLSCGPDAVFTAEAAGGFVSRLATRLKRASVDDIEGGGE